MADPTTSLTASRTIMETNLVTNVSSSLSIAPFSAAIPTQRNKTTFAKKMKDVGTQFLESAFLDSSTTRIIAPHLVPVRILIVTEAPPNIYSYNSHSCRTQPCHGSNFCPTVLFSTFWTRCLCCLLPVPNRRISWTHRPANVHTHSVNDNEYPIGATYGVRNAS